MTLIARVAGWAESKESTLKHKPYVAARLRLVNYTTTGS